MGMIYYISEEYCVGISDFSQCSGDLTYSTSWSAIVLFCNISEIRSTISNLRIDLKSNEGFTLASCREFSLTKKNVNFISNESYGVRFYRRRLRSVHTVMWTPIQKYLYGIKYSLVGFHENRGSRVVIMPIGCSARKYDNNLLLILNDIGVPRTVFILYTSSAPRDV